MISVNLIYSKDQHNIEESVKSNAKKRSIFNNSLNPFHNGKENHRNKRVKLEENPTRQTDFRYDLGAGNGDHDDKRMGDDFEFVNEKPIFSIIASIENKCASLKIIPEASNEESISGKGQLQNSTHLRNHSDSIMKTEITELPNHPEMASSQSSTSSVFEEYVEKSKYLPVTDFIFELKVHRENHPDIQNDDGLLSFSFHNLFKKVRCTLKAAENEDNKTEWLIFQYEDQTLLTMEFLPLTDENHPVIKTRKNNKNLKTRKLISSYPDYTGFDEHFELDDGYSEEKQRENSRYIFETIRSLLMWNLIRCYSTQVYEYETNQNEYVIGVSIQCFAHTVTAVISSEEFYKSITIPKYPELSELLYTICKLNTPGFSHKLKINSDTIRYKKETQGTLKLLKTQVLPVENEKVTASVQFINPKDLLLVLHPYQRRAVAWMLSKEGIVYADKGDEISLNQETGSVHIDSEQPLVTQKPNIDLPNTIWAENFDLILNHMGHSYHCQTIWPMFGLWTNSQISDNPRRGARAILADEMGLGKTIETLALILMNPCTDELMIYHKVMPNSRIKYLSRATLIVTPRVILNQWIEEVKSHTPKIQIYHFEGTQSMKISLENLCNDYDLVFVTYDTLRNEFHFANSDSSRPRRFARKYERRDCPLVKIKWWRVCLDEAQMVQSTVTNIAATAKQIPRVHAWAITGTPVGRYGLDDLFGLFVFLDVFSSSEDQTDLSEAVHNTSLLWSRLLEPSQQHNFLQFLRFYLHRNTKSGIKSELILPKQTEHYVWLRFSSVEKVFYDSVWDKAVSAMKYTVNVLNVEGYSKECAENLSSCVLRLREACCHPQVGSRNTEELGKRIKTMSEVLNTLHHQCSMKISSLENERTKLRISLAQLYELEDSYQSAIDVYVNLLKDCAEKMDRIDKEIEDLKKIRLQKNITQGKGRNSIVKDGGTQANEKETNSDADDDMSEEELDSDMDDLEVEKDTVERQELGERAKQKLIWLENQHRLEFFIASCHHSLKNEVLENEFYQKAEKTRKKILKESIDSFNRSVEQLNKHMQKRVGVLSKTNQDAADLDLSLYSGGIVTYDIYDQLVECCDKMSEQLTTLEEWEEKIVHFLSFSLDNEEAEEASGKEFEYGLEVQEKGDAYQNVFADAIYDRRQRLTGEKFVFSRGIKSDFEKLLDEKRQSFALKDGTFNMRLLISKLKDAVANSRIPLIERELAKNALQDYSKMYKVEIQRLEVLEKDRAKFNQVYNKRLAYYRSLQKLSKQVEVPKKPASLEVERKNLLDKERKLLKELSELSGKRNYLLNLKNSKDLYHDAQGSSSCEDLHGEEANHNQESDKICNESINDYDGNKMNSNSGQYKECFICKELKSEGVLTPCAHFYCEVCTNSWIVTHRKCPFCLQPCNFEDLNKVSFEYVESDHADRSWKKEINVNPSRNTPEVKSLLKSISQQRIVGSFGVKIDTIVKHAKYILKKDPSAKFLVFSQWQDVLDIIEYAFDQNHIKYVTTQSVNYRYASRWQNNAVTRFRTDPRVSAFMLNALSQSAGLTLTAARHVFLVEPTINPSLEFQAIGRVHRIGQTKETFVYRYLIQDSVEQKIIENRHKVIKTGDADGPDVVQLDEDGEVIDIQNLLELFEDNQ